jgi:ectoine hydroxylase-related dioxygenase (phytanoyl-CoA dioxygenase family)
MITLAEVQAFCTAARAASTPQALMDLVHEITGQMGFRYFALVHHIDLLSVDGKAMRLVHYPHPGALPQFPHRDQDMWRGPTGEVEYLINVMWPFTDYRRDNGTTLIWPRSHGANALLSDP